MPKQGNTIKAEELNGAPVTFGEWERAAGITDRELFWAGMRRAHGDQWEREGLAVLRELKEERQRSHRRKVCAAKT